MLDIFEACGCWETFRPLSLAPAARGDLRGWFRGWASFSFAGMIGVGEGGGGDFCC